MIRRGEIRGPITWNCCFFFVYKTNCSCFQLFVYIWWSSFSFFFVAWKLEKKKGRAFILHMGRGVANAFVDLFGGRRSISSLCVVRGGIGGPEGQVVTQKLHDQRWVLVTILVKGVQLGNSLIEGLKKLEKKIRKNLKNLEKTRKNLKKKGWKNFVKLQGVLYSIAWM